MKDIAKLFAIAPEVDAILVTSEKNRRYTRTRTYNTKKAVPSFFTLRFVPFSNILPCLNSPKSHTEQRAAFQIILD